MVGRVPSLVAVWWRIANENCNIQIRYYIQKNMRFTMQISDELYDALKIQDKMQAFRVSAILEDIASMLSIVAELQGFGAIKGGYSIDFNDN